MPSRASALFMAPAPPQFLTLNTSEFVTDSTSKHWWSSSERWHGGWGCPLRGRRQRIGLEFIAFGGLVRRLQEIPVNLVPAFYQHAYDRILYLRSAEATPARALKAIGLYNVITHLLAIDDDASISTIAREIDMTYQGLLPTARYLERVGLVEVNKLAVASRLFFTSKGPSHVSKKSAATWVIR